MPLRHLWWWLLSLPNTVCTFVVQTAVIKRRRRPPLTNDGNKTTACQVELLLMLPTCVEGGEPFAVNTQGDREGVLTPLSRVRERHIVSRSQSRHGIAECLPLAGCVRVGTVGAVAIAIVAVVSIISTARECHREMN
jgi:hypothetical protein